MLKDLSTLVNSIKNKEIDAIQKYLDEITHPVTRGDMFEGITNKIINKTIGQIPLIHVCEGFVKNYRTGQKSLQTDIIIYINNCEDIPNTTSKIVSIDNVLAIIEVKKSFRLKEFEDFYEKQAVIYEMIDNETPFDGEFFYQMKTAVFGRRNWNGNIDEANSKLEFYLYHILKVENSGPLRICFGYEGISKENTLRENLLNVIKNRNINGKLHTGANSLPTLVISNDNCLIKNIGFPFTCKFVEPYPIMLSYKGDVLRVLLTMLFSKIESKTNVRFNYNLDDFSIFHFNDFLSFSINDNNCTQYCLKELPIKSSIKNNYQIHKREPIEITDYEYIVICYLCSLSYTKDPIMSLTDEIFKDHNLEIELQNLIRNGIVSIHDGEIELVTAECQGAIYDGKFYVGENSGGQMTNWVIEKAKK